MIEPWYESGESDSSPGLHALVIGVSDYQGLPEPTPYPQTGLPTLSLTKVKTPATSAWRFAQWLREKYWNPAAPLKSIRLLLSTSAEEKTKFPDLAAASTPERRATKDNVWQQMLAWRDGARGDPRNITVLYASGHGVQWGAKDEALVLLEDFCGQDRFLDYSLSVGATQQGMSGDTMPQTQLYFVDACRVRPEEARNFVSAGQGLQFSIRWTGDDLRCAPIFFAAAPQTYAQAVRDKGTLFSEALLECLDGLAAHDPVEGRSKLERDYYHVRVSDLQPPLEDRVMALAQEIGKKQTPVNGGQTRAAVFHYFQSPPAVEVVVDVDPDEIACDTKAQLSDAEDLVKAGPDCCLPRPLNWKVPAGLYTLRLARPAAPGKTKIIAARPPRWYEPLRWS